MDGRRLDTAPATVLCVWFTSAVSDVVKTCMTTADQNEKEKGFLVLSLSLCPELNCTGRSDEIGRDWTGLDGRGSKYGMRRLSHTSSPGRKQHQSVGGLPVDDLRATTSNAPLKEAAAEASRVNMINSCWDAGSLQFVSSSLWAHPPVDSSVYAVAAVRRDSSINGVTKQNINWINKLLAVANVSRSVVCVITHP